MAKKKKFKGNNQVVPQHNHQNLQNNRQNPQNNRQNPQNNRQNPQNNRQHHVTPKAKSIKKGGKRRGLGYNTQYGQQRPGQSAQSQGSRFQAPGTPGTSSSFPVSSGENHRFNELQFMPVDAESGNAADIAKSKELSSGYQPWVKKDQFFNKKPVSGGMGQKLLQKMGWRPGEGLGKEKTGALEPLVFEVKLDRKGLLTPEESPQHKCLPKRLRENGNTIVTAASLLENKHPVTLLGEISVKNKWATPVYEVVNETGPGHSKTFLVKVIFNGVEYIPTESGANKKEGKAFAATLCLQKLGLLPS